MDLANKDEQTNLNTKTGEYWIKTTPSGEPLIVGNSYQFNGNYYTYIGDFDEYIEKHKDVIMSEMMRDTSGNKGIEKFLPIPNVPCIYTISDKILARNIMTYRPTVINKQKRKRNDDSRPINTEISEQDNTLMSMMKQTLQTKEITRGDFKDLYNNDSDMNNCLRCIEVGGNLSWPRFTDLAERIPGVNIRMQIYDNDGAVISEMDTGAHKKASKSKKKKD